MTQELIERLRRWSNDPGDYLTLGDEPPITLMQEAADALQSQSARIAELEGLRRSIAERVAEGDGMWRTCSGCHESEDGYDVGHYPHSDVFNCKLGGGCLECGGIGAVWDSIDYEKFAEDMIEQEKRRTASLTKDSTSVAG